MCSTRADVGNIIAGCSSTQPAMMFPGKVSIASAGVRTDDLIRGRFLVQYGHCCPLFGHARRDDSVLPSALYSAHMTRWPNSAAGSHPIGCAWLMSCRSFFNPGYDFPGGSDTFIKRIPFKARRHKFYIFIYAYINL